MSDACPQSTAKPARKKVKGTYRARRIGPYSREGALSTLDGRTREARFLRGARDNLLAHLGGKASATQRVLVDQAAMLQLHLAQLDEKALASSGSLTGHDQRQYLAWSNSLTRLLRVLGFKGVAERPPSLADHIAARAGA